MIVNLGFIHDMDGGKRSYATNKKSSMDLSRLEDANFDVSVAAGGEQKAKPRVVWILSFQAGAGGSIVDTQQNVSRLKFDIPMVLPTARYKK